MSMPTVVTSKYREGQHLRHQSTNTLFEIKVVRVLHPEQRIGYELWCESLQLRLHRFEHEVERDFHLFPASPVPHSYPHPVQRVRSGKTIV